MSTLSLRFLEERLVREAPALNWICKPLRTGAFLEGTNLPEGIVISASQGGVPLKGSPFYLSGECLRRWGVDASATMICNELTPDHRSGSDWDRLAEL